MITPWDQWGDSWSTTGQTLPLITSKLPYQDHIKLLSNTADILQDCESWQLTGETRRGLFERTFDISTTPGLQKPGQIKRDHFELRLRLLIPLIWYIAILANSFSQRKSGLSLLVFSGLGFWSLTLPTSILFSTYLWWRVTASVLAALDRHRFFKRDNGLANQANNLVEQRIKKSRRLQATFTVIVR